jgi:WD40 repeat protein
MFTLPHAQPVSEVAFDLATCRILTCSRSNAYVWNAATAQALSGLHHTRTVKHAEFSPDGTQVLSASGENAQLWEAGTGRLLRTLTNEIKLSYAAFSPDGRRVVTCCEDPTPAECAAYVWDVATARRIGEPLRHRDGVNFAIFSPDSSRIVTISQDSSAQVWDAATGRPFQPLLHSQAPNQACFSANGRWVATSWEKAARIWDAQTGEPLTPPLRHENPVHYVQFTSDGQRLLTRRQLGDSRIWNLPRHTYSAEDLVLLSQLLSGHQIYPDVGALPLTHAALENVWRKIRGEHPEAVSVTSAEILAWHEQELARSEKANQWFAAGFHLDWLLGQKPNDPLLLQHRAWVREQAAKREGNAGP